MPLTTSMMRPAVLMPALEYCVLGARLELQRRHGVASDRRRAAAACRASAAPCADLNGMPLVWLRISRTVIGCVGLLEQHVVLVVLHRPATGP